MSEIVADRGKDGKLLFAISFNGTVYCRTELSKIRHEPAPEILRLPGLFPL
jgi:hypothetical protein